jgi:hypothetical protein
MVLRLGLRLTRTLRLWKWLKLVRAEDQRAFMLDLDRQQCTKLLVVDAVNDYISSQHGVGLLCGDSALMLLSGTGFHPVPERAYLSPV